jgi:hypothetical protein
MDDPIKEKGPNNRPSRNQNSAKIYKKKKGNET